MNVRTKPVALLVLVASLVAGCKAPPPPPAERADYTQTLNKYYEGRPMCLWPETVKFPIDAEPDEINELGLAGLASAGLLTMKPAPKGSAKGAKTFDLSPEGRTALNPDVFHPGAGNFCYGRRKIVSIDTARRNSSTTELVDFHYRVTQPDSWATELAIQNAFPQVAAELASSHMAQATLLDTTDGWEISGTPALITAPPPARTRKPSVLAKASTLLHLPKKLAPATH